MSINGSERTVTLHGGPVHGRRVRLGKEDLLYLRIPFFDGNYPHFRYCVYRQHNKELYIYDDGKERLRVARLQIKPRLTKEESEEEVRRELIKFIEKESCEKYDILRERFQMTEFGFQGEIEIYIHSGKILTEGQRVSENERAENDD